MKIRHLILAFALGFVALVQASAQPASTETLASVQSQVTSIMSGSGTDAEKAAAVAAVVQTTIAANPTAAAGSPVAVGV